MSSRVSHRDSIWLNFCVTILGFVSSIVYYNNFIFSNFQDSYPAFSLSIISLLLVAIDNVLSFRYYNNLNVPIRISKWFSIATICLTGFLALILAGIYLSIFGINSGQCICFDESKNLSELNPYFENLFLNIQQYVFLYPLAFGIQTISNVLKIIYKKIESNKVAKVIMVK